MLKGYLKKIVSLILLLYSAISIAYVKGIYITQQTLENTSYLTHLIKRAKAVGIDTFVVDMVHPTKQYRENINLIKDNHINYVARITIFPDGGTPTQINSPSYWQSKYALVKQAVDWGADQIQLDYIRYNTAQHPSQENAKHILNIIEWYKTKLATQNIPMQIDVFGETSFGASEHIGQNIKLFSQSVDAICPMVYPSHYEPFLDHFYRPYTTVYDSLKHIKQQFNNLLPFKLYAYIELSNYHYPMSRKTTLDYIEEQILAVQDAGADGWYAWSPHNLYGNLFQVLEERKPESIK